MAMDNFDDPQTQFLMQMGLGLLGAQTPSFAQALSQGGMMGLQGYQQTQDRNAKRQMQDMTMQEMAMALAARKRQEEYQRQVDELARSSVRQAQAPSQTFAPGDYETPSQMNPGSPGGFDYGAFIAGLPGLGAQGVDKALSMQQMLAKDNPFEKVSAKDFTPGSIAKFSVTRNYADLVPIRKTETMSLGGKTITWDPYNTAPGQSLAHSLTPGEAWSQYVASKGEIREVPQPDGTTRLMRVGLDNRTTPVEGAAPKNGPVPADYQKQISGVANLRSAIQDYREQLKGWNAAKLVSPEGRAQIGTVYNNMMLQAKEAYALGVLNGPDYQILTSIVADPTTPKGALIGKKGLDKQAQTLDSLMEKIAETSARTHRQPPMDTTPRAGNRASGQIGQASTPTVAELMAELNRRQGGG